MKNQEAPEEMKGIVQTSSAWTGIPSELAFVRGAYQGILIAVSFAFLISLLVTRNFLTSFVSIWCVTVIILSVIAFM